MESIREAEPIGPKQLLDVLVIAPCTGNTLAKLAAGIADTAVTMAAKAHLRNGRPVVVAVSTNDGLGGAARNIGELLSRKHYYFVPFRQDDPVGKPTSLVAEMGLVTATVAAAPAGGADTAPCCWGRRGGESPLPELAGGGLSGLTQVQTCHVGSPPDSGREPGFPEKAGGKAPGAVPLDPRFYGPLAFARSFWRLWRIVPVVGLFRHPSVCPDLGTFFRKNAFQHIFLENASQIGLGIPDEIAPTIVPKTTIPKTSERERAGHEPGVQGRPGPLSPHFSGANCQVKCNTSAGEANRRHFLGL